MIHYFNNTPIKYACNGQGTPIVFLHGFLESSTIWDQIATHFSSSHTVITIDLPGFNESGNVSPVHSMELMAQITSEILKVENVEKATLVGHSMGGYVALALAEKYPDVILNLVLLNSSPLQDSPDRKLNRNRALKIIDQNKNAFISMAISNLFTPRELQTFQLQIAQLKEAAYTLSIDGIKAAIVGMRDRIDRTSVLKNFNGKKLLICGEDDAIMDMEDAIKISEETHCTLFKIKSGHMSWLTNSDEIIKILHFIE